MSDNREIKESPLFIGEDETIIFTLTTTPWGSSPTSPSLVVKNVKGENITSDVTTGSASVSNDIITLPSIHSLIKGNKYRMEVKFTISGNIFEAWAELRCTE
jgi:hypothetical protein